MRTLEELIDTREPGLPLLRGWAEGAGGNGGRLLPPDEAIRRETLVDLQVTTRSMLGTVAYETGGLSIADGLIRLLGSAAGRSLRSVHAEAGLPFGNAPPDVLIVGDDMFGGLYALNGGRFGPGEPGHVFHLAADDVVWVSIGIGYTDFVSWSLTGDLDPLYGPLRHLSVFGSRPRPAFETVYSFYPSLWTLEAGGRAPDVRVIDAAESLRLRLDLLGFAVA